MQVPRQQISIQPRKEGGSTPLVSKRNVISYGREYRPGLDPHPGVVPQDAKYGLRRVAFDRKPQERDLKKTDIMPIADAVQEQLETGQRVDVRATIVNGKLVVTTPDAS